MADSIGAEPPWVDNTPGIGGTTAETAGGTSSTSDNLSVGAEPLSPIDDEWEVDSIRDEHSLCVPNICHGAWCDVPPLLATIDSLRQQLAESERHAQEVIHDCDLYQAEVQRLRGALTKLEGWDMLQLAQVHPVPPYHPYDGWYGVATGDAPWARRLIANALGTPDPTVAARTPTSEAEKCE